MKRKSIKKYILFGILLVVISGAALLSAWYIKQGPDQAATSSSSISFRLKWLVYSSFGPHFVALEEGIYTEEGLTVAIHPGGPGLDPIRLVASGSDWVGLASYDQILIAREKGIPIVAIGEDTTKSGVGFMALKESGIKTPEDFIGRKVGVMPGTDKGTMYEALMAKVGIDRRGVVEMPVAFNLDVLLNGTVEVFPSFITNQPIVAANKGFESNIIDPWDYGIRPGGNVYFVTEETLNKQREVLLRFLRAQIRGIQRSLELPDETVVEMVMKHNNRLERDAEIEIWRATKDILLDFDPETIGRMSKDKWRHTAELFHDSGLLKSIDGWNSAFTNELVDEIHAADKK